MMIKRPVVVQSNKRKRVGLTQGKGNLTRERSREINSQHIYFQMHGIGIS